MSGDFLMGDDAGFFAPIDEPMMMGGGDNNNNAFFAAPPPLDEPPMMMGDDGGPILLGGPTDAAYLGDVNEAPVGSDDDGPILLGPPGGGMDPSPYEMMDDGVGGMMGHVDGDGGGGGGGGGIILGEPAEPAEPSPMQKWNAEWLELLKQRKEEENTRKAELIEASRVAMEQFQAEREARRESKMAKNREDEQAKLEAIEADLENDNSWQRVCKMVELSHDSTAKAQDVKRMRDILILLKNEPTRAQQLSA